MKIMLIFYDGSTEQIGRHITETEVRELREGYGGKAFKFIGNAFYELESGFGESATWKLVKEAE